MSKMTIKLGSFETGKNLHTYELSAAYDPRKSFYGKARVVSDGISAKLYSYSTLVAEANPSQGTAKVFNTHSATTLRHIKEFLKQQGFKTVSKSQIEADYMNASSKAGK